MTKTFDTSNMAKSKRKIFGDILEKSRIIILLMFLAIITGTFVSCDKDDPSAPVTPDPTDGLIKITTATGLSAGDYDFSFYSANGKLNRGYSEVFIALQDREGNWIEDFTVSAFAPLMDMGTSKHSTPVGKVEKVEGKALYRTWFSFLMYTGQMNGSWSLDFDYSIKGESGKITGAVPQVDNYPGNAKWIQSFSYNDKTYYISIVSPRSLKEGGNRIQAYINERVDVLSPYPVVGGGFKIAIDPRMPDMENHSSPNNKDLEWNAEKGIYEGTLNLTMTGFWRINLKVFDSNGNLAGGTDVSGAESSTHYWDIEI